MGSLLFGLPTDRPSLWLSALHPPETSLFLRVQQPSVAVPHHGPRAREQALDAGTQKTGLPILQDRPIPEPNRPEVTLVSHRSRPVNCADQLPPPGGAAKLGRK